MVSLKKKRIRIRPRIIKPRYQPGTLVRFAKEGKEIIGTVCETGEGFLPPEQLFESDPVCVMVNSVIWISNADIIEVLGRDYFFDRYAYKSNQER